jgi:hypothetical protein
VKVALANSDKVSIIGEATLLALSPEIEAVAQAAPLQLCREIPKIDGERWRG